MNWGRRTAIAVGAGCLTLLLWQGAGFSKGPARRAAPPALKDGNLGHSLLVADIDGNGAEEILAAAPAARPDGAVLLFRRFPSKASEKPWRMLTGGETFGWSMALLGDQNADGAAEFAVAALDGTCNRASLNGTVTVFRGGREPRPFAVLEGEEAFDRFGFAVAAADLNGDRVRDLVIGAPFHSPSPALYQRGAVYVALGPSFSQAALLRVPATALHGGVGWSFATGDINGDGTDDLLLEATGKVLGFYGKPGFAPSLDSPDLTVTCSASGFGRAIAVVGDIDGDRFGDFAVGAARAPVAGVAESGAVYLIRGGAGTRSFSVNAPGPDLLALVNGTPAAERFGTCLLAAGDADDDGHPDLAVGAVHADSGDFPMTGVVYLLSGSDLLGPSPLAAARRIEQPGADLHFGASLALGEGGRALFVGAPTAHANRGSVHRFTLR